MFVTDFGGKQDGDEAKGRENEFDGYEYKMQQLQEQVTTLISSIDSIHNTNVELARELTETYEELSKEKSEFQDQANNSN